MAGALQMAGRAAGPLALVATDRAASQRQLAALRRGQPSASRGPIDAEEGNSIPVATGDFVGTIFFHNRPKNDAHDLKKWSRKTLPAFLYNLW
jgi:hypothetical protein